MVKEHRMGFIGAGPGVGIQIKNGEYAGRLVFPVYYTNEYGYMSCCVIYSDDHGRTWHRGQSPNDEICLLYEPDDQPGVIVFTKFTLNWVKGLV